MTKNQWKKVWEFTKDALTVAIMTVCAYIIIAGILLMG
jgi:hypothetical protein